eukprot:TRINITY_DN19611_c0_g1_i3.p1 TRINITY_DN19611_c0_g1~~TRINITY_DN19611_c0_g1_i3.p1  ORF type:complete len:564 (+),score=89.03 TRINITY_DN19611_c0_g1_i3:58-1749(+)
MTPVCIKGICLWYTVTNAARGKASATAAPSATQSTTLLAPPPPPVIESQWSGGARFILRPRTEGDLDVKLKPLLEPAPTTVSDDGTIRFGDSLCILNHGTEVLLQAETSTSSPWGRSGVPTTGKILQPCARNTFSLARADRSDGYGESELHVHYGQLVNILASSFLTSEVLYLHMEGGSLAGGGAGSSPAGFATRCARQARWRVLPAPRPGSEHVPGKETPTTAAAAVSAAELIGQVVRVNEAVAFQFVGCGRLLASDMNMVKTEFGRECHVYGAIPPSSWPAQDNPLGPRRATWSFVNDVWADAVAEKEAQLGSAMAASIWLGAAKGSDRDPDFKEVVRLRHMQEIDSMTVFKGTDGDRRQERQENLSMLQSNGLGLHICERVFRELRANGVHGVVKARRNCVLADAGRTGMIPDKVFLGVLTSHGIYLLATEYQTMQQALGVTDGFVSYTKFFDLMEGVGMTEARRDEVRKAYSKLHAQKQDRQVTVEDLMRHWRPQCYPEILAGTMPEVDAFQDFFAQWTTIGADGIVSPETFYEYYRDVSMTFVQEWDFIDMMKRAWGT